MQSSNFLLELAAFSSPANLLRRLLGATPDPWQIEALESQAAFQLILASRGIGKSTTIGLKAAHYAETHRETLQVVLSPAMRQSTELFRTIKKARTVFTAAHAVTRETQDTLELSAGGEVAVIAAAITKALGGDWHGTYGLIPGPGHSPRDRGVSIRDGDQGDVIVHSFADDDWRDIKVWLRDQGLLPDRDDNGDHKPKRTNRRQRPPAQPPARWSAELAGFWGGSDPLHGTAGQAYLRTRGVPIGNHPALRFRPDHQGWPCLVALVTDPVTNEPSTVQRTFLAKDGSGKAPIDPSRKFWPGLDSKGVVRLSPDETVTHGLAVAEGIETAGVIAKAGWRPIWATLSAGNMSALPVLDGIEALTIFADQDEAGIRAAGTLAARWRAVGREVTVRPADG